jgi:hypothetical protein
MRRKPGFSFRLIAALIFAVAGYKEFGLVEGLEIYGVAIVAFLFLGYLAWRIVFRR